MKRLAALIFLFLSFQEGRAACYLLKDAGGNTLHEGSDPPFSLALPASPEAEASRARGERLLIMPDENCREPADFEAALEYVQSGARARDLAAAARYDAEMRAAAASTRAARDREERAEAALKAGPRRSDPDRFPPSIFVLPPAATFRPASDGQPGYSLPLGRLKPFGNPPLPSCSRPQVPLSLIAAVPGSQRGGRAVQAWNRPKK